MLENTRLKLSQMSIKQCRNPWQLIFFVIQILSTWHMHSYQKGSIYRVFLEYFYSIFRVFLEYFQSIFRVFLEYFRVFFEYFRVFFEYFQSIFRVFLQYFYSIFRVFQSIFRVFQSILEYFQSILEYFQSLIIGIREQIDCSLAQPACLVLVQQLCHQPPLSSDATIRCKRLILRFTT